MTTNESTDKLSIQFRSHFLNTDAFNGCYYHTIHFDNLNSDVPTDKITEFARDLYKKGYTNETLEKYYCMDDLIRIPQKLIKGRSWKEISAGVVLLRIDEMITTRKCNQIHERKDKLADETLVALAMELGAPDIMRYVNQYVTNNAANVGLAYLRTAQDYVTADSDKLSITDLNKLNMVAKRLEERKLKVVNREDIDIQRIQTALSDAINKIEKNPSFVHDFYDTLQGISEIKSNDTKIRSVRGNMIEYELLTSLVN